MGEEGKGKEVGRERGRGREAGREGGSKERKQTGRLPFLFCLNYPCGTLEVKTAKEPSGLSFLDSRYTPAQPLFVKAWCLQGDDQRWTNSTSYRFASHGLCHQVPW